MPRKVKIESETLISLIDQFYAEKCEGQPERLKIPQIGAYIRSKGYDVADYLIRRNEEAKAYIEKMQNTTEEIHVHTVAVYRDLDIDNFLMKNNTKEKLRIAIRERENYYREITHSASYSFKENKRLERQVVELKQQIEELKSKNECITEKCTVLDSENRRNMIEKQKLREIVDTYVYPEVANELLKQAGLLKNTAEAIEPEALKNNLITATTDIPQIRNNIIKGLFEEI